MIIWITKFVILKLIILCLSSDTIKSHGCWKDNFGIGQQRPIPWVQDCHAADNGPLKCCTEVARSQGFSHFALQASGACMTSIDAGAKYKMHGSSSACPSSGLGGPYLNEVYEIIRGKI